MPKKSEAFSCKEPSQMEFIFALTKWCWAAVVICLPLTILVSKNMLSIKLFLDEDKCQLSAQTAFRTFFTQTWSRIFGKNSKTDEAGKIDALTDGETFHVQSRPRLLRRKLMKFYPRSVIFVSAGAWRENKSRYVWITSLTQCLIKCFAIGNFLRIIYDETVWTLLLCVYRI